MLAVSCCLQITPAPSCNRITRHCSLLTPNSSGVTRTLGVKNITVNLRKERRNVGAIELLYILKNWFQGEQSLSVGNRPGGPTRVYILPALLRLLSLKTICRLFLLRFSWFSLSLRLCWLRLTHLLPDSLLNIWHYHACCHICRYLMPDAHTDKNVRGIFAHIGEFYSSDESKKICKKLVYKCPP